MDKLRDRFMEAVLKLEEKKLSGKELDNAMSNGDERTERKYFGGKSRNDLNGNGNGYTDEERDEIENARREEEEQYYKDRANHLTQEDIDHILDPCFGERTESIYIPIRNKNGRIDVYTIDDQYLISNNVDPRKLSKKQLLGIIDKVQSDLTNEEMYYFKHPGNYDDGYDTTSSFDPDEETQYIIDFINDMEKNGNYEDVFTTKKLFHLIFAFLLHTDLPWRLSSDPEDKSTSFFLINIPKEEREKRLKDPDMKALGRFIDEVAKDANKDEMLLGVDYEYNDEYIIIIVSDNMDKYRAA